MADTLKTYTVEVFVEGIPTYLIDVPTYQGPEAACRRAKVTAMSHHRDVDFDNITANIYEETL